MKKLLTITSILCFTLGVLQAQAPPEIIKDIVPGEQNSFPGAFIQMDDIMYFLAIDQINGGEFWRTDGTESGTYMVKNIGPGLESYCESIYGCGNEFIVMNDILYFRASDNVHGAELWRSDGTEAGTYMVKDINAGISDCSNSIFMSGQYFAVLDNVLYFAADGGGNNIELWRSDGTEAGTYLVKDFAAGGSSVPCFLTNAGGALYFRCTNGDDLQEVWKTDGTEAGSVLLKQMPMYTTDDAFSNFFIEYEGYVYFSGNGDNDFYDMELWRTDGTPAGTQLFKEINPDEGSRPGEMQILNGKLFFMCNLDNKDVLFTSDGTVAGTVQLHDHAGNDFEADYYHLKTEDKIYFNGTNADDETGLWITDGTDAGTFFLSGIASGSFANYTAAAVNGNNIVYKGYDDDNGCAGFWQSNGTVAGTFQMYECDVLQSPTEIIAYDGKVVTSADDGSEYGIEPWLITPSFTTELPTQEPEHQIVISPNPAHSSIVLTGLHLQDNEQFTISDMQGSLCCIGTFAGPSATIDISALSNGIYILQTGNTIQKFIKD